MIVDRRGELEVPDWPASVVTVRAVAAALELADGCGDRTETTSGHPSGDVGSAGCVLGCVGQGPAPEE